MPKKAFGDAPKASEQLRPIHGLVTPTSALKSENFSDSYALDLIGRHLIRAPVIELGGADAGMIGYAGSFLERPSVLKVSSDAGGAETVIADFGFDAGRFRPSLDHAIRVRLREGSARELLGAAADGRNSGPLGSSAIPILSIYAAS